jgi:hypothetical protein
MAALAYLALVALLSFAALLYTDWSSRAEHERRQQERRLEALARVRAGDTDACILDVEMFEMLAEDALCAKTITSMFFSSVDLGDRRFRRIQEFPNVTKIGFYCCSNADNLLSAAKTLPSVEHVYIETSKFSEESKQSLSAFPSLKRVELEMIVFADELERLEAMLPGVTIDAAEVR